MSAPIGKGDWVECVDDSPHGFVGGRWLRRSTLYCVRAVVPGRRLDDTEALGIRLMGVALPAGRNGEECAWVMERFRPVYRPRQSLIDSLKAPPKEAPIQQPETVGGSAGFGPRVAPRLVPGET